MSNLGAALLEKGNFPIEKESNVKELLKQVKSGDLAITLSSFDAIFDMTPKDQPFPIGTINFEDGKKRFVISWVEEFSKIHITDVEEYSLRVRNYPTFNYPVISLLVGIYNGHGWYYKNVDLDLSQMLTRVKVYQLLNSDEILFCLFDNSVENLDTFGFSLNNDEQREMLDEVKSALQLIKVMDLTNHVREFSAASLEVNSSFNSDGLPKSREALNIYLKRKELTPKPTEHNWNDFLSI